MTSILTNKHFVVALIVAPILAIISYFAVDKLVSPEPVAAQAGDNFPLVPRSNCRWESGRCTLANGDFKVHIASDESLDQPSSKLVLTSEQAIDAARYEFINATGDVLAADTTFDKTIILPSNTDTEIVGLRLAIQSQGVLFFAETGTVFLQPDKS